MYEKTRNIENTRALRPDGNTSSAVFIIHSPPGRGFNVRQIKKEKNKQPRTTGQLQPNFSSSHAMIHGLRSGWSITPFIDQQHAVDLLSTASQRYPAVSSAGVYTLERHGTEQDQAAITNHLTHQEQATKTDRIRE